MITPKIKSLFQFIEYLHSNIDNFNLNNDLIKELELIKEERNKVSSKNTFTEKLRYDKLQAELESKFKVLQDNTANLIKDKAKELKVCNFDNEPNYSFYGIETEILKLKDNFSNEDLPEIFLHKNQYIEYRTSTHKTFLSMAFFFSDLDRITKSLFDYFKETEQNEYEAFETKAIQVNSIEDAVKGFSKGQTKFIIPTFMNNTKSKIQEQLAEFTFFQIEVIADLEFEGKIHKDVKQKNNNSILTPENWEQHKETFFVQRMTTYKGSYTLAEKIKLELSGLEKLPTNKTDYQILKDRYKAYLEQKKTLPPQPIVKHKPELKIDQIALKYAYEGLQITRENGNEIAKEYRHNSGEKLFQRFTYYSSSANRKGKPNLCTPKKLDNKIKLIESIIELLPTDKQERATDEVSILKKIYEAEYQ
jgi:hypothetical protein